MKLHPRAIRAGFRKRVRRIREDPRVHWYGLAMRLRFERMRADARAWPEKVPAGLDLVGFLRGSLGLGESARLLAKALAASDVPHAFVAIPTPLDRDTQDAGVPLGNELPHSVTLLHVNPLEVEGFFREYGSRALGGRKLVGLWYWELEEVPLEFRALSLVFDEVWVASEWLREAFARQLHCPVYAFPFPLDVIETTVPADGKSLPLRIPEERYVFLSVFDHHSSFERKNPEAALRAYLRAFPDETRTTLFVLKSLHASAAPEKHERLRALATGRDDILLFDGDLPKAEMDALFARADCFVSLHRSEGLGLGFLQAARAGKWALTTGYSAPAEFGDLQHVKLVPYRLVPTETDHPFYRGRGRWADPDVDAAARLMRALAAPRSPEESPRAEPGAPPAVPRRHTSEAFLDFVRRRVGRQPHP